MYRKVITLLMLFTFSIGAWAQDQQTNRVVFSIAPNTKTVNLSFRLLEPSDVLSVDFGEGEGVQEYPNSTSPTALGRVSYTFKTVSDAERQIVLNAEKLITIRVVFSNAINGVLEVVAPELTNFNCDFTKLSAHPVVDLSACTKLINVTLTSSGASEVKLPSTQTLKSLQVSPATAPTAYLERINLDAVPMLEELTLTQAMLDTLDLSAHLSLKKLNVSIGRKPLRAIVGAKSLKNLVDFNAKGNALAFDQLPDLPEETLLDKFQYANQKTYLLSPSRVKGLSIDLASLRISRGVAATDQQTSFSWEKKEGDIFVAMPAEKVREQDGVFTFDPSLLVNDTLRVRLTMSNPGYPGIGLSGSHSLVSAEIALTPLPVTELVVHATAVGDVAREIGDHQGLLSLTVSGPMGKQDFEAIAHNQDLKILDLKDAQIVAVEGDKDFVSDRFPALLSPCKKLTVIKFPRTMLLMEQLCLVDLNPQPGMSFYFYTARPPMGVMPFNPSTMFDHQVTLYVAVGLKATYETDGLFSAFSQIAETTDEPSGPSPLNDDVATNTLVIEAKAAGDIARVLNGRFDLVSLTVSGPADSRDLAAIDINRRLRTLDMTGLSILAGQYNDTAYGADVLPGFLAYAYLTKLYLPASTAELQAFAVSNSVKLTDIYLLAALPPKDNGAFASIVPERATLHVRKGAGDAYRAASLWKDFIKIVEDADVSVVDVEPVANFSIVATSGGLMLSAPQLVATSVYAMDGARVWQGVVYGSTIVTLAPGLYIVQPDGSKPLRALVATTH